MEAQIEYIRNLAKQYKKYFEQPETLYEDMSNLLAEVFADTFSEYGDPDRRFQLVALMRAEVLPSSRNFFKSASL